MRSPLASLEIPKRIKICPNKVNHVWESESSTHLIHRRARNSENTIATDTIPTTISLVTSEQSEMIHIRILHLLPE